MRTTDFEHNMPEEFKCEHDFDNAIRKGRTHFICPKCQENITLLLVFMEESKINLCKVKGKKLLDYKDNK